MTALDVTDRAPGLHPSAWPAECGGARRQKLASGPGLALRPGESLTSTTRDVGGWAVMLVQREPGQLYLQVDAGLGPEGGAPQHRVDGPPTTRVERIDPVTLETVRRSPDLPTGGWLWCGATVAHADGSLYVVSGRWLHRLDPDCRIMAGRELPVNGPYNGLVVLPDGNLLTRELGFRPEDRGRFLVVEPGSLTTIDELEVGEPCMGRFSCDVDQVYFTTATEVRRLRYGDGRLSLDDRWRGSYAVAAGQSDGWDTTIGDGSVWLMDMGRPAGWAPPAGTASQRAFRFSIDDPTDHDVLDAIGGTDAWNPGPPLYDPIRHVLVHYDSVHAVVVAHRWDLGRRALQELWRKPLRNFVQMLCWAETGELVVEDAPEPTIDMAAPSADVVVLDIDTGVELGRAPIGAPATFGMFCCPGFDRDFYVASLPGGVARVHVASAG